ALGADEQRQQRLGLEQRGGLGDRVGAERDLALSAGVYSSPNAGSAKVGVPDLHPGDSVAVNCWTVGGNVGNFGDVWYHAFQEIYGGAPYQQVGGWVFAPYVDGAAAFHNNAIPRCP
ncbi:hypothetical protein ABZ391_03095, partial [Kitasatospora cineracea]